MNKHPLHKINTALLSIAFGLGIALSAGCSDDDKKHKASSQDSHKEAAAERKGEAHAVHWGYDGKGAPQFWGSLGEEYATCATGKSQSPIDISNIYLGDLDDIRTAYSSSPLHVVNNGHTIQVNYDKGSLLEIGADTYELVQYHFHAPSEHTIGGKAHAMVAHLVHRNSAGALAVIGVMIDEGKENPVLAKIWSHLPSEANSENKVKGELVNVTELLPSDTSYFTYSGSLTTPPCTEGVRWLVLSQPVTASAAQIEAFRKLFPHNARPVQPVNARIVRLSN